MGTRRRRGGGDPGCKSRLKMPQKPAVLVFVLVSPLFRGLLWTLEFLLRSRLSPVKSRVLAMSIVLPSIAENRENRNFESSASANSATSATLFTKHSCRFVPGDVDAAPRLRREPARAKQGKAKSVRPQLERRFASTSRLNIQGAAGPAQAPNSRRQFEPRNSSRAISSATAPTRIA